MIGYVKTEENHGRCFHCGSALPTHDPPCSWRTACTNPDHGDMCPLLKHKLVLNPGSCFALGDLSQFPWRYQFDDWTSILLANEAKVGDRFQKCTPCGHEYGTVIAKRRAGCILVRCDTCTIEGVYHLPGCRGICAPLEPTATVVLDRRL